MSIPTSRLKESDGVCHLYTKPDHNPHHYYCSVCQCILDGSREKVGPIPKNAFPLEKKSCQTTKSVSKYEGVRNHGKQHVQKGQCKGYQVSSEPISTLGGGGGIVVVVVGAL